MRVTVCLLAALIIAAGPAAAQDPLGDLIGRSAQDRDLADIEFEDEYVQPDEDGDLDGEDTLVDAFVVVGVRPGPAFWKVSDADSTVWVLGVPSAFPRDIEWNQSEMRSHLDGANELVVGTGGVTVNILDVTRILFTMRRFRNNTTLDHVLPPETWSRFQAAMASMDRQASEIDEIKPGYAAFFLSGMFQRELNMRSGFPEQTVTRAARFRVRQRRVGQSGVIDMLRIIENMSDAQALVCLEDALQEVEAGKERALEAARGWARGDLRVAVSAERGFDNCLSAYPEITAETTANIEAVSVAILQSLNRPGKSVAVVDLRPLLAADGILARLSSVPGVTLTAPDVPGLEGEIGAEAYEPYPAGDAGEE